MIVLSIVEQRLDAVRAVLAGPEVGEVAAQAAVHRASVHRWVTRYLGGQIGGLADRWRRSVSCPHQAVEAVERSRGGAFAVAVTSDPVRAAGR